MSKNKSFAPKTNAPLAIFATVLVVAGIVASAWFSSHKPSSESTSISKAPVVVDEPDRNLEVNDILLQNETSVTLLQLDGTSERLSLEDYLQRFGNERPLNGVSVANGSPATLSFKTTASDGSSIDPSGSYTARLGQPKDDGASTIEVSQYNTVTQSIVLRDSSGHALKDASIIGWLSSRVIVASVVATSTRYAYGFERDGRVTPLASLPDNLVYQSIQCDRLWYATAVLGQGLESTPTGPSDLFSVGATGGIKAVAHDDSHIFSSLVCGDKGIAYRLDDGRSFYLPPEGENGKIDLGKRMPLAILSDGRILLRENFDLKIFDVVSQQTTDLGPVPEGEVKVFAVPKPFDL